MRYRGVRDGVVVLTNRYAALCNSKIPIRVAADPERERKIDIPEIVEHDIPAVELGSEANLAEPAHVLWLEHRRQLEERLLPRCIEHYRRIVHSQFRYS